jgi:hypothetical protein
MLTFVVDEAATAGLNEEDQCPPAPGSVVPGLMGETQCTNVNCQATHRALALRFF